MKLLSKLILLMLTSPYLIFPLTLWQSVNEYPPVVSQALIVAKDDFISLLGVPMYINIQAIQVEEEVEEVPPVIEQPITKNLLPLCDDVWRDFKSYMGYKAITSKSSQQYKFISQYMDTKSKDGLLHLKSDTRFIGVALGSYFGKVGSKLKFTLENGVVFYAVKVEEKSDAHTINGCVTKHDGSIVEFVVNRNFYSYYPNAASRGSLHVIPEFKGMITEIEKLN